MSVQQFTAPDAMGASEACAQHILRLLETTLSGRERATLAVSGGSTFFATVGLKV
jgi:6-phosphogluconolactonase/glucosamine-6-phosphate isomerase/deaminase